MHILRNDVLTISVSSHGAELQNIRKGEQEYLWQGDPAYWGRRSPVLFPIVGSVWEKKYRIGGREFELGQHGFARDMDFTLVSVSDTEVTYKLESTDQTLARYPYPFVLEITYRLHENAIDVIWKVTNPSDAEMYFQIGAHPAFIYPDYDKQVKARGYFSLDKVSGLECIRIKEKGCVDAETKYPLELREDGMLPLDSESFDVIDTLMLQDSQVRKVTLHRVDGTPWLRLSFDAPVVGLWSPPGKVAPFICIEPWYGRCDRVDFTGEFHERDWVNRLGAGETFIGGYTIEIL